MAQQKQRCALQVPVVYKQAWSELARKVPESSTVNKLLSVAATIVNIAILIDRMVRCMCAGA